MKWHVVAKERYVATNTYIIRAETIDDAKQKLLDGEVEELKSSMESEQELLSIQFIQLFEESRCSPPM